MNNSSNRAQIQKKTGQLELQPVKTFYYKKGNEFKSDFDTMKITKTRISVFNFFHESFAVAVYERNSKYSFGSIRK